MLTKLRSYRPSHSVVVAYLALFVALGGTSYAAVQISGSDIRNNTIQSRDVKNDSIRTQDIRKNTIKGTDVRNGTLLTRDFAPGQLPAGATGPAGLRGSQGPAGKDGADGTDGSAVAYGYINADGTFDPTRSKGVVASSIGFNGAYCVQLAFTPKNVVASTVANGGVRSTVEVAIGAAGNDCQLSFGVNDANFTPGNDAFMFNAN